MKPAGWTVVAEPQTPGVGRELKEICEALGIRSSGNPVQRMRINGVRVEIRAIQGRVGLLSTLTSFRDGALMRGPTIELRPETWKDVNSKDAGETREIQLGDKDFDALVAIDTGASDEEVRRVLAAPSVRKAVQVLVGAGARLQVMPHGVMVHFPGRDRVSGNIDDVIEWVGALLEVTAAGPAQGPIAARPGEQVVLGLGLGFGATSMLATLTLSGLSGSWLITSVGLVLGPLALLATRARIAETIRGASNSRTIASAARFLVVLNGSLLGLSAARVASWVLQRLTAL